MLVCPIQHLGEIHIDEANAALVRWGHRMGACNRPFKSTAHGMFIHGNLAALTITAGLVRETCAGFPRGAAIELARLCADRPTLNRAMLRLWRECVLPDLLRASGGDWAISYQDEALHSGNTYRLDGWVELGRSSSGTDARSGRKGRRKRIWGWAPDPAHRDALARAA